MKQIILLILCWASVLSGYAQRLEVESFGVAQGDLAASVNPRTDRNGVACGLVKVQLAVEGAKFDGSVVGDVTYSLSEYWVYMNDGAYLLELRCPGFLPLSINLHDHGLKDGVQPKTTYKLVLVKPQVSNALATNATGSSPESVETFTVNGVSFRMVRVEGGTFKMGSKDRTDEKPVHRVTLGSYAIGETEVTQELWLAVMGSNPSKFNGSNLPVEQVSWEDCQEFIRKLNAKTGRSFRLPTEAEWEFAARGGNKSGGYKYSGSNNIDDVAWYDGNSNSITHPVKTKQTNELGLYDMSGNVWEWCQDRYGSYGISAQTNPTGPSGGSLRVGRGGSWYNFAEYCRSSNRNYSTPSNRNYFLGLRLAL